MGSAANGALAGLGQGIAETGKLLLTEQLQRLRDERLALVRGQERAEDRDFKTDAANTKMQHDKGMEDKRAKNNLDLVNTKQGIINKNKKTIMNDESGAVSVDGNNKATPITKDVQVEADGPVRGGETLTRTETQQVKSLSTKGGKHQSQVYDLKSGGKSTREELRKEYGAEVKRSENNFGETDVGEFEVWLSRKVKNYGGSQKSPAGQSEVNINQVGKNKAGELMTKDGKKVTESNGKYYISE